jgi:hypothetical protein
MLRSGPVYSTAADTTTTNSTTTTTTNNKDNEGFPLSVITTSFF